MRFRLADEKDARSLWRSAADAATCVDTTACINATADGIDVLVTAVAPATEAPSGAGDATSFHPAAAVVAAAVRLIMLRWLAAD